MSIIWIILKSHNCYHTVSAMHLKNRASSESLVAAKQYCRVTANLAIGW